VLRKRLSRSRSGLLAVAFRHSVVASVLLLPWTARAATPLTLRVASESVPAGGWAQIKVFCDTPALISQGVLEIDLDPSFFGAIEGIASFSASGDVLGYATVNGTHLTAAISSPSGGIGQLPGIPVFTVRVPVLSGAAGPGFVALSLPDGSPAFVGNTYFTQNPYPQYAWTDPQANPYNVSMISGAIYASGTLSVQSITPGGGLQPVGTVLRVDGTGFDANTKITADGIALSPVQYVSATEIDITLASAAEISGVPFHVQTGNLAPLNFFPALASAVRGQQGYVAHVILPQVATTSAFVSTSRGGTLFLQNPTPSPVNVRIVKQAPGIPLPTDLITVAPGEIQTEGVTGVVGYFAFPDQPLRMGFAQVTLGPPWVTVPMPSDSSVGNLPSLRVSPSPASLSADYQTGTTPPPPQIDRVTFQTPVMDAALKTSGEAWFSVAEVKTTSRDDLTITFDPSGLTPGTYQGTISITPVVPASLSGFSAIAATIPVALRVSAQPTIAVQTIYNSGSSSLSPAALSITSNGSPAAFTIKATTLSGGSWLSTDLSSGVTPATVQIQANPAGLAGGYYTGTIRVQGPTNFVDESISLRVDPLPTPPFTANPSSVSIVREAGASGPPSGGFIIFPNANAGFSAAIDPPTGVPWLTIMVPTSGVPTSPSVFFNVDATGLSPGTYTAAIVGTSGTAVARAAISLTVVPKPTHALIVTPARLTLSTSVGAPVSSPPVSVTSPDGPVLFSFATKLGSPLQLAQSDPAPSGNGGNETPETLRFTLLASQAGSYQDELIFTTSYGEVRIPVSLYITAAPSAPPVIASVVNAASQLRGPISPGEIITIRGIGVGPPPVGLTLDSQGRVAASASGAQVLINGVAAPIVYGSISQWNVVVPYEVDGAKSATIRVSAGGAMSAQWTVPVVPSAPALFTSRATGIGYAAVVNQDGSINSPANPAPRGTVVSFYVTGEGQTSPDGITGSVTQSAGVHPRLQVSIQMLGNDLAIQFAGEAPGLTAGVMQVNAVLPRNLPFGGNLPVQVRVGDATSPQGIAISVE
jgi:uncharacterized protein (TIGR03437 family)